MTVTQGTASGVYALVLEGGAIDEEDGLIYESVIPSPLLPKTVDIVLYQGTSNLSWSTVDNITISISGDATLDGNNITATGDFAITINSGQA